MHRILMRHSVTGWTVAIELDFMRIAREHCVAIALTRVHLGSVVALNGRELVQRQLDASLGHDVDQKVTLVLRHVHLIRVF